MFFVFIILKKCIIPDCLVSELFKNTLLFFILSFLLFEQVVLKEHADDNPKLAITGSPIVCWPKKTGKV